MFFGLRWQRWIISWCLEIRFHWKIRRKYTSPPFCWEKYTGNIWELFDDFQTVIYLSISNSVFWFLPRLHSFFIYILHFLFHLSKWRANDGFFPTKMINNDLFFTAFSLVYFRLFIYFLWCAFLIYLNPKASIFFSLSQKYAI